MILQSYLELGLVFVKVINREGKIADSVIDNRGKGIGMRVAHPHLIFL